MSFDNLVEVLAGCEFFSAFEPGELRQLAEQAEARNFKFGDTIFNHQDRGDGMFVIKSGTVRIFAEDNGKEVSLGVRRSGEVIAEIAALREYHHEYSARASGKTELLFLPRSAVTAVLSANQDASAFVARYVMLSAAGGFVTRLFNLRGKFEREEMEDIIRSIGIKRIKAGEVILQQGGQDEQRLHLIRQGSVGISYSEDGVEYHLATLRQGDVFGEQACLQRQPQAFTASADSDSTILVIPQQTVRTILERNPALEDSLNKHINTLERELKRQQQLTERRKRPFLLDLGSKPKPGERLIKRFALVEQAEEMDCGAACLSMICRHYNIPITLGKLREMANVTTEGATLESLAWVGESLGFTTRGLQCNYEVLLGFDLPFIAHWEGYHYIVVYGVSKHHVWVADPGAGFRKLGVAEFEKGWTGTCLLFTPGTDMVQLAAARSPWVRFVRFLRPHKKTLGYLLLAALVIEALGVAPPVIIQNILDRVVVHQNVGLLHLLIVGFVLTQIFIHVSGLLRTLLANFIVRHIDFTMMSQFFQHTLSLPVSFFAKRRTGDIFARFQENQTIRNFLTESTVSTILNLLMLFLYFIVLFLYSAKMTLLLIILVIPMVLLTLIITPKIKAYARRDFEASTDAEAVLMETLSGAETIKAMGIERPMRMQWERKYAKALNVQYDAQRFQALVVLVGQMLQATATIVLLWVGASLVLSQELSIGQLIAFNMLMGSVMAPIMGLISLWDELHEAGVAMERLGDVLDMEPEQKPENLPSRILLPGMQGDIRFDSVYFRYGGKETPYVLENISFELRAGETVAVVGLSGSGKTTLAKLLVGFYPPSEGKIFVDDYDLTLLDKEYYRAQIGYVMQNNLLFSGTVVENIALGVENPDRRRVDEVSRLADAHGFISKLPLGYEQVVGERGVGLSGGQIQRICIARALYHDPRLLIFDEATSALDTQSEANILKNMQDVIAGRTALIIAHRLSTVMSADKILALYQGGIVEEGTHQELLDRQGMYYQLVQKQISA